MNRTLSGRIPVYRIHVEVPSKYVYVNRHGNAIPDVCEATAALQVRIIATCDGRNQRAGLVKYLPPKSKARELNLVTYSLKPKKKKQTQFYVVLISPGSLLAGHFYGHRRVRFDQTHLCTCVKKQNVLFNRRIRQIRLKKKYGVCATDTRLIRIRFNTAGPA